MGTTRPRTHSIHRIIVCKLRLAVFCTLSPNARLCKRPASTPGDPHRPGFPSGGERRRYTGSRPCTGETRDFLPPAPSCPLCNQAAVTVTVPVPVDSSRSAAGPPGPRLPLAPAGRTAPGVPRRPPSPGGRGWSAGPGGRSRPGAPPSCCGSSWPHGRSAGPPAAPRFAASAAPAARPAPARRSRSARRLPEMAAASSRPAGRPAGRPVHQPALPPAGGAGRGGTPGLGPPPSGRAGERRVPGAAGVGEGEGGLSRRRNEREQAREPADPSPSREQGRFAAGGVLEIPNSAFVKNQQTFPCGVCSCFAKPLRAALGAAGERRASVGGGGRRCPRGHREGASARGSKGKAE